MSTSDDIPPSDDFPPPTKLESNIKKAVSKLNNKNELSLYLDHLSSYHTYHLSELTQDLQERLLLQGLDQEDLFNLHEFLAIEFESGLLRTTDKKLTQKRASQLQKLI